jgi:hypothetical protein
MTDQGMIFIDRPVKGILEELGEMLHQNPEVDSLAHPLKRPDVTVVTEEGSDIYELKPIASKDGYKHGLAKKQLAGYINTLFNRIFGGTKGGDALPSESTVPFHPAGDKATITFTPDEDVKGLYYYQIDDGMDK